MMSFSKSIFKFFGFVACLLLVIVCFVACGEDEKITNTENTTSTATVSTETATPTSATQTKKPTKSPTKSPTKEPTPKVTPTPTPVPTPTPIRVGDILTIGKYEQEDDVNGIEDLQWIVLERQNNKALVITKYIIECIPFDKNGSTDKWENCSLRTWINNDFYNTAFSNEEKSGICPIIIPTEDNPNGEAITGNEEKDNIFILSISEIEKYFKTSDDKICLATTHADKSHSVSINGGPYEYIPSECNWWLRLPSVPNYAAGFVGDDGVIYCEGYSGYEGGYIPTEAPGIGVRPAMWITIE